MKYYDADDDEVSRVLDEMADLLTGDQLVIFEALRAGVSRPEIAYDLGISKKKLYDRISYIYKKVRTSGAWTL